MNVRPNGVRRSQWVGGALVVTVSLMAVDTAHGVAFISSIRDAMGEFRLFTDLPNQPDAIFSWDEDVITYKLDATIYQTFPHVKQREQIRLGMSRWSEAHDRDRGNQFDFTRQANDNTYFDLRSIVMHEMGHVLGSQHVNVAWDRSQQNYVPNGGGGWIPQQDVGTEIMHDTIAKGEIRRVLTLDELDMHDHAYNRTVTFQEVFGATPADINILACGGCLGFGGVDTHELRVNGQPELGRRTTAGSFFVGDGEYQGTPIGFKTLKQSWEFDNDFFPQGLHEVLIRTRGTDNPNPTSQSNHNLNQFSLFDTVYIPDLGILNFEDVAHRWFNPDNGNTVPLGQTIKLGLEQDVPDWFVLSAAAQDVNDQTVSIELITIAPWENNLLNPDDDEPGDDLGITGKSVLARGFRVVAPGDVTAVVSEVSFAEAGDLNLDQLEDLSSETLDLLRASGQLESIPLPNPIALAPGEDFVFVADGTIDDLPPDLVSEGNFLLLGRPELAEEELFVFAASGSSAVPDRIGNFALLNTGVFVPEPSTVGLLIITAAIGLLGRRRAVG